MSQTISNILAAKKAWINMVGPPILLEVVHAFIHVLMPQGARPLLNIDFSAAKSLFSAEY